MAEILGAIETLYSSKRKRSIKDERDINSTQDTSYDENNDEYKSLKRSKIICSPIKTENKVSIPLISPQYTCAQCPGKSYKNQRSLSDHLRKVHRKSKNNTLDPTKIRTRPDYEVPVPNNLHLCPRCPGKSYKSHRSLYDHLRKVHRIKKKDQPINSTLNYSENNNEYSKMSIDSEESSDEFESESFSQANITFDNKEDSSSQWSIEDHNSLLDQIQLWLPKEDSIKFSTMVEKINWSHIHVGSFSPSACKDEWLKISTRLRRYRTLTDLVNEARVCLKLNKLPHGGKKLPIKHPDMPKKPLTPYFKYFVDNREIYFGKNPHLNATDLAKLIAKEYAALPEDDKQRITEKHNLEMEQWKTNMLKFKEEHPDLYEEDDRRSSLNPFNSSIAGTGNGPPKTTSAMQIYINKKYTEEKNTEITRKQLYEFYKNKWLTKITDKKKLKYILQAIKLHEKYKVDMEEYCKRHPEFQPRIVNSFLTKAEQKIKDIFDGKPQKPPSSGYSLFTLDTYPSISSLPSHNERMTEISKRWKRLSDEKKETYNQQAEQNYQKYKLEYSKYLSSLPEEDRKNLDKGNKKSSKKLQGSFDKPIKPIAAVFIFIEEEKEKYRKNHLDTDDNELTKMLVRDYHLLNDQEKAVYKKKELEEKLKMSGSGGQSAKLNKKIYFPGEPIKPPYSGYQLFSREMLIDLTDYKGIERLQEIGKRWVALAPEDKALYKARKDQLWTQYKKDLANFKKSMSRKEKSLFEAQNRALNTKKKKKPEYEGETDEEEVIKEEDIYDDDDDEVVNNIHTNAYPLDRDTKNGEHDLGASSTESSELEFSDSNDLSMVKVEAEKELSEDDDDDDEIENEEEIAEFSEEETASQMELQLTKNTFNYQGKPKLNANDVYDDSSEDGE